MKDPVDHILRPQLPWRDHSGITECGYNAEKVPTLSRDEFFARIKELGRQRAAMITCMTCSDTAGRWGTWADDPRKAVEREIQWECGYGRTERGYRLRSELEAIENLIKNHQDEFNALLDNIEQRKAWIKMKDVRNKAP